MSGVIGLGQDREKFGRFLVREGNQFVFCLGTNLGVDGKEILI